MITKIKKYSTLALLPLLAIACSKEVKESSAVPQKKTSEIDFPYEIYHPVPEDQVYDYMEQELQDLFAGSAGYTVDATKAIFLWETGINYIYTHESIDENTTFTGEGDLSIEREVTLDLNSNDEINVADFITQMTQTNDDIEAALAENDSIAHAVTDVAYVSNTESTLTLKVTSSYYKTRFGLRWGYVPNAQVANSTQDKKAGEPNLCGGFSPTQRAVFETKLKAWSTLPTVPQGKNVVGFETYGTGAGNRYLDGSYLPGNTNPNWAGHAFPLASSTCLYTFQRDHYDQLLRDQIALTINQSKWAFDGIAWLRVDDNQSPNGLCMWGFVMELRENLWLPIHALPPYQFKQLFF